MRDEPTFQLIESARQGEAQAIQALLLRYQPDLARFARSVCATPEDAEDAVQEALWIAVQKIGTLRVAAAFTTWLFQVVKRECYRLLRHGWHEASIEQLAVPPYNDDSLATQAALAHDIAVAIAGLAPHYRQVLIMRDVQSMSAPEVAATLGMTVEAVKSRLHRARMLVRAALRGWEDRDNPSE
jgi:RNA polymerase sigma factor (sigma-70 family)